MTREQLLKLGIATEKDNLTDDEIFELLEKKKGERDAELSKNKDLLSKRNGEIAEYKRKEQEKLSEEEKTKLHYEELERELASVKRENALSKKIADYVGIGYDGELAKKVAEAELDGRSTIELHKQFIKAREESIKAELLKGGSKPKTESETKTLTKAEFNKLGYSELLKLQEENPVLYDELSKQ